MSFDFTARPGPGEFGEYHVGYLAAVPAGDIREVLANESQAAVEFYRRLPASRAGFSYAPGKWTIAETMAHIADGERVFAYRALFTESDLPTALVTHGLLITIVLYWLLQQRATAASLDLSSRMNR